MSDSVAFFMYTKTEAPLSALVSCVLHLSRALLQFNKLPMKMITALQHLQDSETNQTHLHCSDNS